MRLRVSVAFAALLLVAGCGREASGPLSREAAPATEMAADAAGADIQMLKPPPPEGDAVPAGTPMLAYSYRYGIEASPKGVRALIASHEAACQSAGAAVCQVTSSNVQEMGEDDLRATLSLRASPAWLKAFRDGLSGEVKTAGGRVTNTNVSSEDLSRRIVDTEAALRAKTTLRDRLQALLAQRPGKLSDLVELERELARVQGEIDATQSELTLMRTRVATSDLTVDYRSGGVLAPEGVLSPLADAVSDVLGIIVSVLAFMIRLAALLLPWVLMIAAAWWLLRKRLPKIRLRRRARQEPPPPAS